MHIFFLGNICIAIVCETKGALGSSPNALAKTVLFCGEKNKNKFTACRQTYLAGAFRFKQMSAETELVACVLSEMAPHNGRKSRRLVHICRKRSGHAKQQNKLA